MELAKKIWNRLKLRESGAHHHGRLLKLSNLRTQALRLVPDAVSQKKLPRGLLFAKQRFEPGHHGLRQ